MSADRRWDCGSWRKSKRIRKSSQICRSFFYIPGDKKELTECIRKSYDVYNERPDLNTKRRRLHTTGRDKRQKMSVSIDLTGKNAIVTGGGDGIGKETARTLAQAGTNVLIADLNDAAAEQTAAELAQKYGVKTWHIKCNVACVEDVQKMAEFAAAQEGRIDILNHIAGVSRKVDFLEADEKAYDFIMDINAKGTFFVDQAILKLMIPNRAGKIVNMSSMSGKEGYATNVAYSASKFAVTGITQAVAKYAAPYNINVNCVCPGIVRTAIWEGLLKQTAEQGGDAAAYWEERIGAIPLKRPQTVQDVANLFLYLSSEFADNMTGQGINVTGGLILH